MPVAGLVPAPESPILLEEGRPVERVLGGGERHEHRVAAEAGWYVRLEIEQVGVDVAASLLGPDGAVLFSTDDPDGLQDKEIVAVIAPAAGELVLAVTPGDAAAAPGAYRVKVTARRPAGPGDIERAAAQKAMAGAWHLGASQEADQRRAATSLYQEAARLWQIAGETRAEIDALNEQGILQNALFETSAALASFERALSLSVREGDLGRQASSHNNLAVAYKALGEYDRTLEHYERALGLWREVGDAAGQGLVLYGMGILHRDRGDLAQAVRYLSEALPLRRAAADVRGELFTLLGLAIVHLGLGEMEQASGSLEQALRLGSSAGQDARGPVLATEAQFHRHRGAPGEALARLREARDLYRGAGNASYEVRVLHQMGALYLELGDLEGARESFQEGLDLVSGKSSDGEARFRNRLGWTLYLGGDTPAALASLERALDLSRRQDLPAEIAQALEFTGLIHVETGRAREGAQLLQEALALRRQNRDLLGVAKGLLSLGRGWRALEDLDRAAASFAEALQQGRQMGDTALVATCLYHWALLDRQRGDLHQALGRIEEALRIIESVRSRVTGEKLRITFLASKRAWYELDIDLRLRLEEKEPGQGHAAAALETSERARARGLLDLIAEGRINVQEGIAPQLKRREMELGARLSWIQEQIGLAPDPTSVPAAELRAQLDEVGREMEQLEEEIRFQHPRYAQVRYPTPLRLGQIQDLLDEGTTLLEYFVGREGSFLFVVTREGFSAHRLPPADVLRQKVQDLRTILLRSSILTVGRFRREAGGLHDILLGPLAARLERTPDLLISPDGPLTVLPFEVLLTDSFRGASYKDLSYLLREHSVSYVPSASVLAGLREPRPAPEVDDRIRKRLVAFGDPIYPAAQLAASPLRGPVSPATAPQLPGTGREVDAIAGLYPEAEVVCYLRGEATEENVKANPLLQTAQRIHFATHGLVDEARPHLSGLMLTRLPDSREDGLLQVHEIFNLRLDADLVTLSACETGLGEQVTGEGMVGLTRAFLYAGARSLVVSLWPVSDQSTPELMTSFYRHLGDARTKTAALRQAKLERIEAGVEPHRWAPFILAGESR
jgi:CHAT domain-containing protein/tetratricopeptide (TPR) repeat protein